MEVSRLHNMGWKHRIGLREGISSVYAGFAKVQVLGTGSERAIRLFRAHRALTRNRCFNLLHNHPHRVG